MPTLAQLVVSLQADNSQLKAAIDDAKARLQELQGMKFSPQMDTMAFGEAGREIAGLQAQLRALQAELNKMRQSTAQAAQNPAMAGTAKQAQAATVATNTLNKTLDDTKKKSVIPGGLNDLPNKLRAATDAANGLLSQLLGLMGINLSQILALGTVGGLAAAAGVATRNFMNMQDELFNVRGRFRMLGLETEDNTRRFYEFGRTMQNSFGIAAQEARRLSMTMLQQARWPERYQEMARSAIGFGEALGVSTDRAAGLITQLEAGNYMVLRRLHPNFRRLIDMGAGRLAIEQEVNRMIAEGTVIARERMQTFGGQMQAMKNSFTAVGRTVAEIIGPAFVPMIQTVAQWIERVNQSLRTWFESNRESAIQTARNVTSFVAASVALRYMGGAFGLLTGAVGRVLPGLGLLRSTLGMFIGFNPFSFLSSGLTGISSIAGIMTSSLAGVPRILTNILMAPFIALPGLIGSAMGGVGRVLGGLVGVFNPANILAGLNLVRGGVASMLGMLMQLPGRAMAIGLRIVMSLCNPFTIIQGLITAPIMIMRVLIGTIGMSAQGAAGGVRILSMAFKGLLMATGIGLILALVSGLLGLEDTFGETGAEAQSFTAMLQEAFAGIMQFIQPIWNWIRVEGMIVFRALIASARQLWAAAVDVWEGIKSAAATVWTTLRSIFGGVFTWLEENFGETFSSIGNMWAEFTAQLSVVGLRIKQVGLMVVISLAVIAEIINWLAQCFLAFINWFGDNWVSVFVNGAKTVWEAIKLVGVFLQELTEKISDFLSDPMAGFDMNFERTSEQFERLATQASQVFSGLEMPELDLSGVAPGLRSELDAVTSEIGGRLDAARRRQSDERERGRGPTGRNTPPNPYDPSAGRVMIGARDKAHFTDPTAFWKRLQEAAANQRVEEVARQQLQQQQEMVRILNMIHVAVNHGGVPPPPPPGPVIPR